MNVVFSRSGSMLAKLANVAKTRFSLSACFTVVLPLSQCRQKRTPSEVTMRFKIDDPVQVRVAVAFPQWLRSHRLSAGRQLSDVQATVFAARRSRCTALAASCPYLRAHHLQKVRRYSYTTSTTYESLTTVFIHNFIERGARIPGVPGARRLRHVGRDRLRPLRLGRPQRQVPRVRLTPRDPLRTSRKAECTGYVDSFVANVSF